MSMILVSLRFTFQAECPDVDTSTMHQGLQPSNITNILRSAFDTVFYSVHQLLRIRTLIPRKETLNKILWYPSLLG